MKKVVIGIILLLVLCGSGYILYDKVLKDKEESKKKEVKKEKVVESDRIKLPKDLDDYMKRIENVNDAIPGSFDSKLLLIDKGFKEIDFKIEQKCKKDNEKVKFDQKGIKVEYTCSYDEDMDAYIVDATVNDSFKQKVAQFMTCGEKIFYTNGEYYIVYETGCYVGGATFKIYKDNKVIKEVTDISSPTRLSQSYNNNLEYSNPFVEDKVLYYIDAKSKPKTKTTCTLKAIDLSGKTIAEKTGSKFDCYHEVID